jgi:oligoribonuclease
MGMDPEMVEAKLIDLINKHFPESSKNPKKRPILTGNSIMQDRLFIDKYFKNLSARLHYRMVDVSSFKVVMTNKFNLEYRKQNSHRALDDIRESIGELRFYLDHIKSS